VAVRSVQLQLVCGTVCQRQCSLLSHWTFFDAAYENWTVRAFLQLIPRLSNDFTAAWLTFAFPQIFAVAVTLKSIDCNVAMAFILLNNNNNNNINHASYYFKAYVNSVLYYYYYYYYYYYFLAWRLNMRFLYQRSRSLWLTLGVSLLTGVSQTRDKQRLIQSRKWKLTSTR